MGFLRKVTGVLFVLFWICEIDGFMRDVKIARDDDAESLFSVLVQCL